MLTGFLMKSLEKANVNVHIVSENGIKSEPEV